MPSERQALNVAVIPSVSGGLGHISRTLKLARALHDADPSLHICYVLSERFLRPFNVDVVRGTGFPVRMLPDPTRQERDQIVNEVLGDIDVVIEDTERRLIAYRPLLPRLSAWISVPMLPLWDELFMDWPLLDHADHILYTLPPELPVAEEIARFRDKMTVTGPILDEHAFPERRAARRRLGLADGDTLITYAPRGFPFGPDFGMTVLDAVVGAFI